MSQIDNVSIVKKSNQYFDGKCVSHTFFMADGTKKSLGVIFPSTLRFTTGAPEKMEITGGKCRILIEGETEWQNIQGGQSFDVGANSFFDIEVAETVDYVCHYG